ncbi:MAG: pyridoxal-phosphate dependent enzyme [Melioribacteraceae bacterium]|nr:pyridoxal-phosphate dependent enzyme [Melioribacteraceae bacterium]
MNYHYSYQCFNCSSKYSAAEIEENLIYLCLKCGSSEKNRPLKGVLEVVYDYESIKAKISKESFLSNNVGEILYYPYLWPIEFDTNDIKNISKADQSRIALNSNNISEINYDGKELKIFDDSRNPTLSYKDRASILVALKAKQLGINEISAASTGNAGSSLAGICSRLNIKSHIFVPKNIPASKRIQIQAFGANIYIVDGDYDEAFDLCLEVSKKKKWYNRNTAYNPLTIEGKKSSVYDMFIELYGKLPENIFVSVGDGVIISGIYKGLVELFKLGWIEKLPRLFAIQAEGSDALVRFLGTGVFDYIPASTAADSISAGAPRNLYMAANAVKKSDGKSISVTDSEIINAQKILSQKYGILAEPAAAASLAGFIKLKLITDMSLTDSMLMITGNGLKDATALESWNEIPINKTYDQWITELI